MSDFQRRIENAAEELGFKIETTRGGHQKFIRPGLKPIFAASTPSDHRAYKNIVSQLKRGLRQLAA